MRSKQRLNIAAVAILGAVTGCGGGGMSRNDMLKYAIKRPSDDDGSTSSTAASPSPSSPTAAPSRAPSPTEAAARTGQTNLAGQQQPAINPATANDSAPAESGSARNANPSSTAAAARRSEGTPQPNAGTAVAENSSSQTKQPATPLPQPAEPLTLLQRRARTISNLTRIGEALIRYLNENGRFPAPALYDANGRPLLSWRVELLPYLGHDALYKQFELNQPWDSSPRNKNLVSRIPAVYQSPDRFDERTNYLVPTASTTVFQGLRGVTPRKIQDGADHTVILLEVDDDRSVPWTSPRDYSVQNNAPTDGLGGLREDGFFVVWGSGLVGRIAKDVPPQHARAMFSIDGGEPFLYSQINKQAVAEPEASPTPSSGTVAGSTAGSGDANVALGSSAETPVRGPAASPQVPTASAPAPEARYPVPSNADQQKAMTLIADVYRKRYEEAKSPSARKSLATEMITQSKRVALGSADQFVLLEVARNVALELGDANTADQAMDELVRHFEMDAFEVQYDIVQKLAKRARSPQDCTYVLGLANELIDSRLEQDDFKTAKNLYQLALEASRRSQDPKNTHELARVKRRIDTLAGQYAKVTKAIDELDASSSNETANLIVGDYYCLCKGQWEKGLPMLVQSSDARIKHLAQLDLAAPTTPEEQIRVADGWWELAGEYDGVRRVHALRRSVHWYRQAGDLLPVGLLKSKVEIRLKEAQRDVGPAHI